MRKIAKLLLALSLVLGVLFAIPQRDDAANSTTQSNLRVTLSTDQAEYKAGDEIQVSVELKNGKPHKMEGIGVKFGFPAALEAQFDETTMTGIAVDAGGTHTVSAVAKMAGSAGNNLFLI